MKFVALLLFVAAASALPTDFVPVVRREETRDEFGQYTLNYETADGIMVNEQGTLKEGPEGHVLVKSGSYDFTAPEGQKYKVTYVADENGYRAHGEHLPTSLL